MDQKHPYIVTSQNVSELEGTQKTHFLNLNAQRLNKSLGDLTGLKGLGFHIIEVAPDRDTTEFHVHHHEDECVYILEGNATAEIGDKKYAVAAGDFIGYPAGGEAHNIINTGDQTLKMIVVGQRLPFDIADYPKLEKRIYRQNSVEPDLVDHADIANPQGVGKK
jgi:uncharacterized cupin superfamily protein